MANDKSLKIKNGLHATTYLQSLGTVSSHDLDLSTGQYFVDTISQSATYSFSNASQVKSFVLEASTPSLSGDLFFFGADAGNSSNYNDASGWTTRIDLGNQGTPDTNFYLASQTVPTNYLYSISFTTGNSNAGVSGGTFMCANGATFVGQTSSTTTVTRGSTVVGESVVFLLESNDNSSATYTPPSGYTLLFHNTDAYTTASGTAVSYKIATSTSESTDGGTFSAGNTYRALVEVRNAGVAATSNDIYSIAHPFTAITSSYSASGDISEITVTWPSSIKWEGGSAPSIYTGNVKNLFTFVTPDGGTTYYGKKAAEAVQ